MKDLKKGWQKVTENNMIEVKNLKISFGDLHVLKDVSIDIKKGEKFTEENLTAKRPGSGISPMNWAEVLGKIAKRDFSEDELIEL